MVATGNLVYLNSIHQCKGKALAFERFYTSGNTKHNNIECINKNSFIFNDCGNNMPTNCTGIDPKKKIRNYWQPDLYWFCEENKPAARRCGNNLFFQEELGECVWRFDYKWSCPSSTARNCENNFRVFFHWIKLRFSGLVIINDEKN
ncbi:hypothetical protein FF38_07006 [Lucilia cuprina]|uniref:Chitin-binding type-2 domain-containing protein n=1 Tax=Lucilia cuprina TaxID=7375 RepID=A0A0L0CDD1_LUCCU|nr:hypothetical protein FF38_07006 [Lucilia cuprina]